MSATYCVLMVIAGVALCQQDIIDEHCHPVFLMVARDNVGRAPRTSCRAWPIATPSPAFLIIGMSLTSSPTAQIAPGSMPHNPARCRMAVHLLASWRKTSHIVPT